MKRVERLLWVMSILTILALSNCSTFPQFYGHLITRSNDNVGNYKALQSPSPIIPETWVGQRDTPTPLPNPENSDQVVKLAIQDLAIRLNISPQEIDVVSATLVERPSQEASCKETKEKITLPAYKIEREILLNVNNKVYQYVAYRNRLYYCGILLNQ